MKKQIVVKIVISSLILLVLLGYEANKNLKKVVESDKTLTFNVGKNFSDIRKSISQGRFEEEILKINNATILEKEWKEKELYLEKPLSRRNRYWEFNGVMNAKVKTDELGSVIMQHNIQVSSSNVKISAILENPVEEVGLSDLEQSIELLPDSEETKVKTSIKMKLKRLIPSFMQKYAQEQLDKEAENYLIRIQDVIKNLPEARPGFYIPLKNNNEKFSK